MSKTNDTELKKAALVIAKLLLRTREGRIQWVCDSGPLSGDLIGSDISRYSAKLEDGIEAILVRDEKQLGFLLSGPPIKDVPYLSTLLGQTETEALFSNPNNILTVSLNHSYGNDELSTPESIVYRDLEELIGLARNPKSVSDDQRYQQVMTYLDRLSA